MEEEEVRRDGTVPDGVEVGEGEGARATAAIVVIVTGRGAGAGIGAGEGGSSLEFGLISLHLV